MTDKQLNRLEETAETFRESAEKVEDGINKVLEPRVKDAQVSSDEARDLMQILAKRVTIFLVLSFAINAVTLSYFILYR